MIPVMMTAAVLLVMLLVRQGYGWPFIFGRHVHQIKSRVNYDPNLSDSFFATEERVCPNSKDECDEKSRLKATAKCFSSIYGEHAIHFCKAGLLDDGIEICFYGEGPGLAETLLLVVENGVFSSQYKSFSRAYPNRRDPLWITKKQELTLDKEVYHEGDVIKGRIYFECVSEEATSESAAKSGPLPYSIIVKGVFKTIVKSSLYSDVGKKYR